MKRFELCDWEISGYFPYVPQLGMDDARLGTNITDWIPATVPGSVHQDLWRAGWIEDPYFGMNSLRCEWVENKWWAYRTRFDVSVVPGRRYHLRMNGLDYKCRIYVNDVLLMLHEGSFDPVNLDVTELLKAGENRLMILFESAPDEESQAGHSSHTRTQKSRFSYKWDFSTRMVPVGIWDDIWLEETGEGTIDSVWLIPELKDGRGKVTLHADCGFRAAANVAEYELSLRILQAGKCLADSRERFSARQGASRADLEVWIDDPQRWYPNGLGAQPLYDVEIRLIVAGSESTMWTGRIGFRDLRWIQNEQAPEGALPYCMQVNGERVYMKGVNLTPFDMLIGTVSEEKYRLFLQQIRAANINFVRVNGVGLIEKECFYNLCDEYGLLVWQEFIQTSSSMDRIPPTLPSYMKLLGETSKVAIRIKRNHVSLACYCGGNELNDEPKKPATYSNPNIAFLQDLINTYDTGRMLFPTSATGPSEFLEFGRQGISHDVHGPWNFRPEEHYRLFNQSDCLLHGELGAEGMAHTDSLVRFLAPQDLKVTNMKDNLVWRHHGDWWDTFGRDTALFGEIPSLATFVGMSQLMQAEAIRYALESNRRRKYHNSGSMMWAFNEPFPNVSNTCLVDYYGVTKMAYYATQDAYSALHMSLRYDRLVFAPGEAFEAQAFVHNSLRAAKVEWKAQALTLEGRVLHEWTGCTDARANATTGVQTFTLPVSADFPRVFMLRLTFGEQGTQPSRVNEYLFSTRETAPFHALLEKKPGDLRWSEKTEQRVANARREERVYEVTNAGPGMAMFVTPDIPGENEFLYCDASYKSLLPGETRLCRVVSWKPGKSWDRCRFVSLF